MSWNGLCAILSLLVYNLFQIKGLRSEREREIQSKREKLEALFNRLNVPDAERVRVTNTIPKSITPATINKVRLCLCTRNILTLTVVLFFLKRSYTTRLRTLAFTSGRGI